MYFSISPGIHSNKIEQLNYLLIYIKCAAFSQKLNKIQTAKYLEFTLLRYPNKSIPNLHIFNVKDVIYNSFTIKNHL